MKIDREKEKLIAELLTSGTPISAIRRQTGVAWSTVKRIQRDLHDLVGARHLDDPLPDSPGAIRAELGGQAVQLARYHMSQARLARDPKEQAALARTGGAWLDKALKFLQAAESRVDMDLEAYILALEAEEQRGEIVSI